MRFCADASFVVSLYDPLSDESRTESILKYLTDDEKVVTLSDLCRVEVLNVLLRKPATGAAEVFESDLKEGARFRVELLDWSEAFQQAESLARRFSRTLKPGGHDLVLVATAVTAGASWFLSFDRNSCQRALAAAAGLSVWPALDKDEKGLMHRATRGTSR